jgi:hypothetical protein
MLKNFIISLLIILSVDLSITNGDLRSQMMRDRVKDEESIRIRIESSNGANCIDIIHNMCNTYTDCIKHSIQELETLLCMKKSEADGE